MLSLAPAYAAFQRLVGAEKWRSIIADEYLRGGPTDTVLDIGCGTAEILESLDEDVAYVGFDPNPAYVASAEEAYGHRASFTTASVGTEVAEQSFSIVMALGVLHHLDDGTALRVFETARSALAPGGRFVSVDPTFVDGQSRFARLLIKADRGQRVRTPPELDRLSRRVFDNPTVEVRSDMLRIPYTHAIVTASV